MTETTARIKVSLKAEPRSEPVPRREEIPRVVRMLALAHRWHRLIDEGHVKDQAEIATLMGLTRARVTQIMNLRWLHPRLQEELIDGPPRAGRVRGQAVRRLISTSYWPEQSERSRENE
jgi:hypothetical protein